MIKADLFLWWMVFVSDRMKVQGLYREDRRAWFSTFLL